MSEDRPVHTDALRTLGTIIDDKQGRDAIHIAVEPVVAGDDLKPGQHVGFRPDGTVGLADEHVGIVDPFLTQTISKGERFWLLVYPRTITSLRHVWEHPAIPSERPSTAPPPVPVSEKEAAEVYLRACAASNGIRYERLISGAEYYLKSGDYINMGENEDAYVGDEFWDQYEILTGQKVSASDRGSFFSCAC